MHATIVLRVENYTTIKDESWILGLVECHPISSN